MKNNVAVLTTHRANNYGAILQSYALTYKINQLGYSCEILDYRCPYFERLYHSSKPVYTGKNPFIFLRNFIVRFCRRHFRDYATVKAFSLFRKSMLKISNESYYSKENLSTSENLYNVFIVGSDQIWNPDNTTSDISSFDRRFFLDFVKDSRKKNSYAASIGRSQISEDLAALYRQYLFDFRILTLREHKGSSIIEKLTHRDVHTACDPVLLLDNNEWEKIESPPIFAIENDFILVYCVGGGLSLEDYAWTLAARYKCNVYFIQPPVVKSVCSNNKYILRGVGPAEFIWLIHHARAVVTSSFHCSAFSLLFMKELHVKYDEAKHINHRNSRIDSLFAFFEITQDQINLIQNNEYHIACIHPCPQNLEIIKITRQKSTNLLIDILQER